MNKAKNPSRQSVAIAAMFTLLTLVQAAGGAIAATTAGAPAASASAAQAAPPAGHASMALPPAGHGAMMARKKPPAAPIKRVDINFASKKELKTLPGIGEAEADKIIANRPYCSKADLASKNVMLAGPYAALKDRVALIRKIDPKKCKG